MAHDPSDRASGLPLPPGDTGLNDTGLNDTGLNGTGLDDTGLDSAAGDRPGPAASPLPAAVDPVATARRRYGTGGAILAAGMLGIDKVLGRRVKEEAPIVIAASDQPVDIDTDGITVPLDDDTDVVAPPQPRPDPFPRRPRRRRR